MRETIVRTGNFTRLIMLLVGLYCLVRSLSAIFSVYNGENYAWAWDHWKWSIAGWTLIVLMVIDTVRADRVSGVYPPYLWNTEDGWMAGKDRRTAGWIALFVLVILAAAVCLYGQIHIQLVKVRDRIVEAEKENDELLYRLYYPDCRRLQEMDDEQFEFVVTLLSKQGLVINDGCFHLAIAFGSMHQDNVREAAAERQDQKLWAEVSRLQVLIDQQTNRQQFILNSRREDAVASPFLGY